MYSKESQIFIHKLSDRELPFSTGLLYGVVCVCICCTTPVITALVLGTDRWNKGDHDRPDRLLNLIHAHTYIPRIAHMHTRTFPFIPPTPYTIHRFRSVMVF